MIAMFILAPGEPYPSHPEGQDWALVWPKPPPS